MENQEPIDYEATGRFNKACKLSAVLRGALVTSEEVALLTAEQWELTSKAAGLKNPKKPHSDKTIAMVAQMLKPVDTLDWERMTAE